MPTELTKQQITEIIPSVQKFFREELECDLSEMKAKFVLAYIMQEIGPYAYNLGVADAESYFRSRVEDLPAICFQDGLTYWTKKKK